MVPYLLLFLFLCSQLVHWPSRCRPPGPPHLSAVWNFLGAVPCTFGGPGVTTSSQSSLCDSPTSLYGIFLSSTCLWRCLFLQLDRRCPQGSHRVPSGTIPGIQEVAWAHSRHSISTAEYLISNLIMTIQFTTLWETFFFYISPLPTSTQNKVIWRWWTTSVSQRAAQTEGKLGCRLI